MIGVPASALGVSAAAMGTVYIAAGAINLIGASNALQMANQAGDAGGGGSGGETTPPAAEAAKNGGGAADDVFHVTPDGVVLPKGPKHKIPEGYFENPHRSGSYGEIVNGKFKERLRIDPPTPPRRAGPNRSHYHLDGKGKHHSPASIDNDKDPGF
ncbi:hypothetical protein LZ198_24500 [Myxococcus sp. K15C18031901]|uniref:hypothetical protein n=1 Tax=Myxococcus dinghuensis TaxID=2906761 RepID=UPI0020A7BB44|nr:hypothetical protein [Myxococcus dinghuensis]MCP3102032.1 hypothetical protein [Myxococcus dinghuensis]